MFAHIIVVFCCLQISCCSGSISQFQRTVFYGVDSDCKNSRCSRECLLLPTKNDIRIHFYLLPQGTSAAGVEKFAINMDKGRVLLLDLDVKGERGESNIISGDVLHLPHSCFSVGWNELHLTLDVLVGGTRDVTIKTRDLQTCVKVAMVSDYNPFIPIRVQGLYATINCDDYSMIRINNGGGSEFPLLFKGLEADLELCNDGGCTNKISIFHDRIYENFDLSSCEYQTDDQGRQCCVKKLSLLDFKRTRRVILGYYTLLNVWLSHTCKGNITIDVKGEGLPLGQLAPLVPEKPPPEIQEHENCSVSRCTNACRLTSSEKQIRINTYIIPKGSFVMGVENFGLNLGFARILVLDLQLDHAEGAPNGTSLWNGVLHLPRRCFHIGWNELLLTLDENESKNLNITVRTRTKDKEELQDCLQFFMYESWIIEPTLKVTGLYSTINCDDFEAIPVVPGEESEYPLVFKGNEATLELCVVGRCGMPLSMYHDRYHKVTGVNKFNEFLDSKNRQCGVKKIYFWDLKNTRLIKVGRKRYTSIWLSQSCDMPVFMKLRGGGRRLGVSPSLSSPSMFSSSDDDDEIDDLEYVGHECRVYQILTFSFLPFAVLGVALLTYVLCKCKKKGGQSTGKFSPNSHRSNTPRSGGGLAEDVAAETSELNPSR